MHSDIKMVLHVLNGAMGGAAESTQALIQGLAERDIDSVIYVTNRAPREAIAKLERAVGVQVFTGPQFIWAKRVRLRYPVRLAAFLHQMITTRAVGGAAAHIMAVARAMNVNLVHSSTMLSPDGAIAARALGLPHVWHVRELVGLDRPHRLRGDDSGKAAKRLIRSGQVVCNSHTSKSTLFGPDEVPGVFVVPNGLDLGVLSDLPLPDFGSPLVFGMVANLTAEVKEHRVFVDAARLVARQLPGATFRIFGLIPEMADGSTASRYARSIVDATLSADLHGRLSFEGFVPTPDAICDIDILVHPARGESFGRIYVEAMAGGRPVVAPRGTVAEEILGEGEGFLCEAGNPDDFARGMLSCAQEASSGVRNQSLVRLRERALATFGLDAYVDGVLDAYAGARTPEQIGRWRATLSVLFG